MLEAVLEDARFEAAAKQVTIDHVGIDGVRLRGNGELLIRAIENLLHNAIRHTPSDKTFCLNTQLTTEGRALLLQILDPGPGVFEAQLTSILEPLFRAGGTNSTGVGHGLAIARRAVEVHGGITAQNQLEGAFVTKIVLPLRATESPNSLLE